MGGSAQQWTTILPDALRPGTEVALRLVMTKFGPPTVDIGCALCLERP
ncbi:MAG: hypothetical protein V3V06_08715 [Dehalococcoidia bacterium]